MLLTYLYYALFSYRSIRGGTNRGLRTTHRTFRLNGCGRTGVLVSDVGVLCPGTFRAHHTNVNLVRRIRLGRRRGDLICLSDVLRTGRGSFSTVGKGCAFRGSTRCRGVNGCLRPSRIVRGGLRHSFLHFRMSRGKIVDVASVCYKTRGVRRITIGIATPSNDFTRAPTTGSDCRAASLNRGVRGTSFGLKRSKGIVKFLCLGGSGGVGIGCRKRHPCSVAVATTSHRTLTDICRLTRLLSSVARVGGGVRRTGLGVRFMGGGVRREGSGTRRWGRKGQVVCSLLDRPIPFLLSMGPCRAGLNGWQLERMHGTSEIVNFAGASRTPRSGTFSQSTMGTWTIYVVVKDSLSFLQVVAMTSDPFVVNVFVSVEVTSTLSQFSSGGFAVSSPFFTRDVSRFLPVVTFVDLGLLSSSSTAEVDKQWSPSAFSVSVACTFYLCENGSVGGGEFTLSLRLVGGVCGSFCEQANHEVQQGCFVR